MDREQTVLLHQASRAERIGRRNARRGRPVDGTPQGGITREQFEQIRGIVDDPGQWREFKKVLAERGVEAGQFSAGQAENVHALDFNGLIQCVTSLLPLIIGILPLLLAPDPDDEPE